MTFTQSDLRSFLGRLGIPSYAWQLPDATYETVHDDYVPEVWEAWIESLRRNAPECLMQLAVGGGKTRTVPRWVEEGGDCDDHGVLCTAHAIMGSWISVCRGGPKVARTVGFAFYTAMPRAENRNRAGGHCQMWQINHAGEFKVWEPGDGQWVPWTALEYQTARFGFAA